MLSRVASLYGNRKGMQRYSTMELTPVRISWKVIIGSVEGVCLSVQTKTVKPFNSQKWLTYIFSPYYPYII